MDFDLWGFSTAPFLRLPTSPFGLGLAFACALLTLGVLVYQAASFRRLSLRQWLLLGGLLALAVFLGQTFLVRVPANILPPPGVPVAPQRPALALFVLLPVFLAGGWLGTGPALLVGLAAGLSRAIWETYSVITPFEYALLALLSGWALRQDYRDWPARLLRQPLFIGLFFGALAWLLLIPSYFAYAPSADLTAWDYVWSQVLAALPVYFGECALAGLLAALARLGLPAWWIERRVLRPPPYLSSLTRKLLFVLLPVFVFAIGLLFWANIRTATSVSTDLMVGQMAAAADSAGRGIPFFIQTGQNLIANIAAQSTLQTAPREEQVAYLSTSIRAVPYFRQLTFYDPTLTPVAGYPADRDVIPPLLAAEQQMVTLALAGIPQNAVLYPANPLDPVDAVFALPVLAAPGGDLVGVLVGHADLANNPVMASVTNSLQGLAGGLGQGFIVDERGIVIYHPDPTRRLAAFAPETNGRPLETDLAGATAYQDKAPDGTRRLVLYYPVPGHPWSVVVMVPNFVVLSLAAQIATPALILLLIIGLVGALLITLVASRVTRPAQLLALAAQRIADNQLDESVVVGGEDEIGRAGLAFERMRQRLRARLQELNMLLQVSQNVAGSLNLDESLPPILSGAVAATGAAGARLVLADARPGEEAPPDGAAALPVYTAGAGAALMAPLDRGVLDLTRTEDRVAKIENLARARTVLDSAPVAGRLQAVLALPLRQEHNFYGALWLGYDQPHTFTETEVNFLTTLAGQAAVSVANARLFDAAEQGRQRLEAILASTPDAVIVTDRGGRVLRLNPAAEAAFDLAGKPVVGRPVAQVLPNAQLVKLLTNRLPGAETPAATAELELPNGRTLFASASTIISADSSVLGRVCVLRDVTHFKELDQMKSEFVATVSHDLRAPLTFMRGYATMLPMVGPLNEKQREFGDKIITGIEQMTVLIDNLLDLGRIEAGVGLARESVRMDAVIHEALEPLQAVAANRNLSLQLEVPAGLPNLSGDPTLLRQAVTNLVDNALKYTPGGGQVRLRAQQADGQFTLTVSDTGVGIAPADQAHLFEKFFRVRQRGSTQVKGSGLGLAIVKSIVERHGGRVWVESKLGQGTLIGFSIPAAPAPERRALA
ncbi:MAG: HAMP domain-containing protein [Anaerolineales bacterium]|nr:HAMP domain-containing protein [Anaerolineales bacterium]